MGFDLFLHTVTGFGALTLLSMLAAAVLPWASKARTIAVVLTFVTGFAFLGGLVLAVNYASVAVR